MKIYHEIGLALGLTFLAIGCSSSPKGFSDSVEQTIEAQDDEFQKCYASALKQKHPTDPVPMGRIEMGLTVNPAGKVTEANVIKSEVQSLKLEKCVQETLRRIQFPKNDEGRIIQTTYPFDFAPKK